MKTSSFTFVALCLLSFTIFFSCADAPPGIPAVVKAEPRVASTIDTISESRYNTWTSNWETHGARFTDTMLIKSFTIPQIDLTEVFGETPRPAQARFVHGLDMSSLPFVPHLLVVGVDANGRSMIDYANGQYVYDLSCPCPKLCGVPCTISH